MNEDDGSSTFSPWLGGEAQANAAGYDGAGARTFSRPTLDLDKKEKRFPKKGTEKRGPGSTVVERLKRRSGRKK